MSIRLQELYQNLDRLKYQLRILNNPKHQRKMLTWIKDVEKLIKSEEKRSEKKAS